MYEMRELRRSDLISINKWRSNRKQVSYLGAPYRYVGPEIDEAWFEAYLNQRANTVRCAVIESTDPEAILGLATIADIDWINRSGVFHVQVSPESQGVGVGWFALTEMLKHAFNDLGLHRMELDVLATNVRALRMYEKAGFALEGTRRQAIYKNGSFVDMHVMGLLVGDWQKHAVDNPEKLTVSYAKK